MRISQIECLEYLGPHDAVELDLPDGPTVRVRRGELVGLPGALARQLLAREPQGWRSLGEVEGPLEPGRLLGVRPSELARRSLGLLRARRGWTLEQLAARAAQIGYPLSLSQLSRLESGKRGLGLDELLALCLALNVSPAHVVSGAFAGEPADVAVSARVAVTGRRFRAWLRGQPLPRDERWREHSGEPWGRAYRRAVSDEDWLELQRTSLRLAVAALRRITDTLLEVADQLPEQTRHQLADALDELKRRLAELQAADSDYPTERQTPSEGRGRPRTTAPPAPRPRPA